MDRERCLIVLADDYGIGPATSQGILDLAGRGLVTGAALLVTSPHAEGDVQRWQHAGVPLELGWHLCFTLDRPVLPAARVPSLVQPDGSFWPLGRFIGQLMLGAIHPDELLLEMEAQYDRFVELVGARPKFANSHHHVQVFHPIGQLLIELLQRRQAGLYVRKVREPWRTLVQVPGARLKRGLLSHLGRQSAHRQEQAGFPGNDWLVGITNPPCLEHPDYLGRWLRSVPGQAVELTCHPGYFDDTLLGRDATATDGLQRRRVRELELLAQPSFHDDLRGWGFRLVTPSQLTSHYDRRERHAA